MKLSEYPEVGNQTQAAEAVGVDRRTIAKEIESGNLTATRAGSKILVTRYALYEWLGLPTPDYQVDDDVRPALRVVDGGDHDG